MKKRDKVTYIPYSIIGNINEYTVNMIKILERKYDVDGKLAEPLDILKMISTKAVFLNWVEEELNIEMKIQLCLYKMFGTKIIWVFHNRFPHQANINDKRIKSNIKWLADRATYIMIHSISSEKYIPNYNVNRLKKVYIPHVMYQKHFSELQVEELRRRYGIQEENFVFTMFGAIKKYKKYEEAINAFIRLDISGAKLILAGNCMDKEYVKYLKTLCDGNDNIVIDMRYIPDKTLGAILFISDVIVIPYVNNTSMNSGVMIQAFSNERTVIIPDICMARDLAIQGFFYGYKNNLDKVMLRAFKNGKEVNRIMGQKAYEYISQHNNERVVSNKIYSMLDD